MLKKYVNISRLFITLSTDILLFLHLLHKSIREKRRFKNNQLSSGQSGVERRLLHISSFHEQINKSGKV
ncbi:MAG: hypothetical protein JXI43_14480 [Tissierellales bacterium]|nr:hypothetical protein [Tissierellales bacterium]